MTCLSRAGVAPIRQSINGYTHRVIHMTTSNLDMLYANSRTTQALYNISIIRETQQLYGCLVIFCHANRPTRHLTKVYAISRLGIPVILTAVPYSVSNKLR
jgi:hypothetical protein